jgi:hypothetical protein
MSEQRHNLEHHSGLSVMLKTLFIKQAIGLIFQLACLLKLTIITHFTVVNY